VLPDDTVAARSLAETALVELSAAQTAKEIGDTLDVELAKFEAGLIILSPSSVIGEHDFVAFRQEALAFAAQKRCETAADGQPCRRGQRLGRHPPGGCRGLSWHAGVNVVIFGNRLRLTPWHVMVSVPNDLIDAPFHHSIITLSVVGLLGLLLSVAMAGSISGKVQRGGHRHCRRGGRHEAKPAPKRASIVAGIGH
jgi:hypothetical protein